MLRLGMVACAFGRHSVDRAAVKRVHGQNVGRCRCCAVPLEESYPNEWVTQAVRDAGLGPRLH